MAFWGKGGPFAEPVQTAIHLSGNRLKIVSVAIRVDVVEFPILAGDLQGKRRSGGKRRIVYQIHPERLAVLIIIRPSRQLQQTASFEPRAVTLLGVAQVLSPLICRAVGEFLGCAITCRFLAGLPEKVRDPQAGCDIKTLKRRSQHRAHFGDDFRLAVRHFATECGERPLALYDYQLVSYSTPPLCCEFTFPGTIARENRNLIMPAFARWEPAGPILCPFPTVSTMRSRCGAMTSERVGTPIRHQKASIFQLSRRISPTSLSERLTLDAYSVDTTGGGRNSTINRKMSTNRCLGTATLAIWKAT